MYSAESATLPGVMLSPSNSDNCSVMKGIRDGLITKLRAVQPSMVDVGCICLLSNLAVGSALEASLFDLDSVMCEVFNYFTDRYVFHKTTHTSKQRKFSNYNKSITAESSIELKMQII